VADLNLFAVLFSLLFARVFFFLIHPVVKFQAVPKEQIETQYYPTKTMWTSYNNSELLPHPELEILLRDSWLPLPGWG